MEKTNLVFGNLEEEKELKFLRENEVINVKDINIEDLRSKGLIKAIREYLEEED